MATHSRTVKHDRPEAGYIRARISLVATADGGRQGPIASGYRPGFWLDHEMSDGLRSYYDAEVLLESSDWLAPGAAGIAWLRPYRPEYWARVREADELEFYEGLRLIGTAEVLEVGTAPATPPRRAGPHA